MNCLLGIDVGTSGVKVALFGVDGNLLNSTTVEYPLYQPKSGWAEQNPEDWWEGTCRGIRQVLAKAGGQAKIEAIGLSGQMHGAVLLDSDGKVIRPAIIWCDQRSVEQAHWITEKIGAEEVIRLTGNPALPNFTATKVLWVRDNEPGNYERIAKVLLPKDYIRYRLTGEYATEVSDASGTLFLDVPNRKWSQEMLSFLEIDPGWMPACYESTVVSGTVSAAASKETGLTPGVPVVGGAGDQAAGAVGNGIVWEGLVSATIGTSGVVFAATDSVVLDKLGRLHSFCHAINGKWHVMGVTQAAGGSLQWYRNNFASEVKELASLLGRDPYEFITEEAGKVAAGSEGLMFLPYLLGERTPHLNPFARGVFFGIESRHDKRHFARAIMEGVTFSLRDCLELISNLGVEFSEVRASGGGARSVLWRQMMADIFGIKINTALASEGPAFGVALLGAVGAGIYASVEEACGATIKISHSLEPRPEEKQFYSREYALFRGLYESLKDRYDELRILLNGRGGSEA